MKFTIVIMVQKMILDCADVIPQSLWAEACSTPVHIKYHLPQRAVKLKQSSYEIIFGDKPLIKYL
jgi:hypothetical protein